MSKLIVEMEMPKDCPMCPMAHFNVLCEFTGCEVAPGKRYAIKMDKAYAESACRPDWCPIKGVLPEEHGDLVDYDEVKQEFDRLLTYMETVPDENNIVWFRRETIVPRGYEMKFHIIVPAERRTDE